MHVKSLIIEGFKSYGQRTEIKGFDKEFNAITGLNGSGKSNILDAICFVLGISNLGHVRAGSLQELVYKNGQAGITKASVSITFDNSDGRHKPLGFETFKEITVTRQIVLGGKNKYLLNGVNVLNKNIQDFFCSVQLNVNNPHFLIMQGRITKVLNMKPNEILSMIEEAAGTRMYEAKKIQAQKTIEKKDARLKEITTLADEEVAPKIQKLKDERIKYLEYQKVQREAEYLSKVYIAWRYVKEKENEVKAGEDFQDLLKKIENINQVIKASEKKEKEIESEIEQLQKQRGSDLTNKLTELEKKLKDEEKVEMKKVSGIKALKDSISSEENKKKQLGKNLKEEENLLKAKEGTMKNAEGEFEKLRQNEKTDAEALLKAQARYQAACSGMFVNEDGSTGTLQDKLIDVRQRLSDAESELKCSQMELDHNMKELKMKEPEANKSNSDYTRDTQQLNIFEKDLKKIEEQMTKLNHEEEFRNLQEKRRVLRYEVEDLKNQINNIEMRYPSVSFHYRDPVTNFDRSSVYGVVCRLMKLKDPKFAQALEIAAGGKLYQVIVDKDTTSKLLIERGNLLRRTTMIPLNKILGRRMDAKIAELAKKKVGNEHVTPALDLVNYPSQLQAAFEYVFSDVLIVTSIKHARELAFDDRIRKKCVTIEGDVVDPGGTLSGGSAPKQGSILLVVQELVQLEEILKEKQYQLDEVEKKLQIIEKYVEQFQELHHQHTKKSSEIQALRIRVEYSSHHQTKMEVEGLKQNIDELKQKIAKSKEVITSLKKQEKEIENNMKNSKALQEKELKTAEKEMNQLKKRAEDSSNRWKQREQEYEMLQLEIEELKKSFAQTENDIKIVEKEIEDLKKQLAIDEEELIHIKKSVAEKEMTVKEQKNEIAKQIQEIQEMTVAKEKLVSDRNERQLNVKLLDYEKIKFKDAQKDVQNRLKDILEKYEWIKEEEQYFGQPNGMYDFQNNHNNDYNELSKQVKKLNEQREKLSKTVNSRAISLLGKEEEQYRELMNKKEAVAQDKDKIMKVIDELDEKKREALMRAWEQVNKDFGSIFSSLLPGALAKLSPPQGMTVLEGLEVKVGFGNVWKESLGELSGGQRSLVALSLILAMLLFKPAPIYILDEVDAALDLSHTQNIGSMLKTHFKHSQFIVVSLKDGMFTNANVLFRTKFVDGFSTVARFTQGQQQQQIEDTNDNENDNTKSRKKMKS